MSIFVEEIHKNKEEFWLGCWENLLVNPVELYNIQQIKTDNKILVFIQPRSVGWLEQPSLHFVSFYEQLWCVSMDKM